MKWARMGKDCACLVRERSHSNSSAPALPEIDSRGEAGELAMAGASE